MLSAAPKPKPARSDRRIYVQFGSLERAAGIEPASLAWKAKVLPLHNARAVCPRLNSCPQDGQAANAAFRPLSLLFYGDHLARQHLFCRQIEEPDFIDARLIRHDDLHWWFTRDLLCADPGKDRLFAARNCDPLIGS